MKKQDADKGLRFKRFPPVLFLQLCRFEIDQFQRTHKINEPVKFYEDLDLNPFVYVPPKKEKKNKNKNGNGENKENIATEHQQKEDKDEDEDEDNDADMDNKNVVTGLDDGDGDGVGVGEDQLKYDPYNRVYNHLAPDKEGNGEFSYQLYSVLVHSGSTGGGHYYAYINPSGHQWYKFDDERSWYHLKKQQKTICGYGLQIYILFRKICTTNIKRSK